MLEGWQAQKTRGQEVRRGQETIIQGASMRAKRLMVTRPEDTSGQDNRRREVSRTEVKKFRGPEYRR
jgi:hypothetical protein